MAWNGKHSLQKEAIAVYDPEDPIEHAIQHMSHQYEGQWLTMYRCQLMARALESLKVFDNWLDNDNLLMNRISYLFIPQFTDKQDIQVVVTHPIYLRDILENKKFSSYIFDPFVLMTPAIAHYIFKEYPLHMYINFSKLKASNPQTNFMQIGGLTLVDEEDVNIKNGDIEKISCMCSDLVIKDQVEDIVNDVKRGTRFPMSKAAVSEVGSGVFKIDEDHRDLYPDMRLWDKQNRGSAIIDTVEPGETGNVNIITSDGVTTPFTKEEFDLRFVVL